MFAAIAIAALLFMLARPEGAASTAVIEADKEELTRLYQKSPETYAKVMQALNTVMNPADMVQMAIGLHAEYPKTSAFLMERFKKVVTPVTGKSGTTWNTWTPGRRVDGWIEVHVMYEATPVIAYMQNGADKSSRQLLGVAKLPQGLPADLTERAKKDFV